MKLLAVWLPADGKPVRCMGGLSLTKIHVYDTCQIRFTGGPLMNNTDYFQDWWVLRREDVSALTDEEWLTPTTGWVETWRVLDGQVPPRLGSGEFSVPGC